MPALKIIASKFDGIYSMKEVFVFDVDGTLTESRQPMDPEFKDFMLKFVENRDVFLVTGSDRLKTYEQLGFEFYEACTGVWQCNGNVVSQPYTEPRFFYPTGRYFGGGVG